MAIVVFTPETVPSKSGRASTLEPRLNINQKTGTFLFNQVAAELLGLEEGARVKFLFDEDSPEDWFVIKSKDGFPLRVKDKSLICQTAFTARKMLESHSVEKNSCSCKIKTDSIVINRQTAYLLLFIKR